MEEIMNVTGKIRSTVLAAGLMAATVAALPTSAEARWHGGWGWGGVGLGLAAGALIGGALAAPYYGYYGYYPGYYAPAYYAPYPVYGGYYGGYWDRPYYWHRHRYWRHW
jgi:hypothetical protein